MKSKQEKPKQEQEGTEAKGKLDANDNQGEATEDSSLSGRLPANSIPSVLTSDIIEELAELEHQQWETWSRSLISQLLDDLNPYESVKIRDRVLAKHQRWLKLWKPYDELTEEEKEQDRIWARKVLAKCKHNADVNTECWREVYDQQREDFTKIIEKCRAEMDALRKKYEELTAKFNQFGQLMDKRIEEKDTRIRELEQERERLKAEIEIWRENCKLMLKGE